MPIYEYECLDSGHRFEARQRITDSPLTACNVCGGRVRKLISRTSFFLKGGGWYKDGYALPAAPKKDSGASEPKAETASPKPETKTDTSKAAGS